MVVVANETTRVPALPILVGPTIHLNARAATEDGGQVVGVADETASVGGVLVINRPRERAVIDH